jgi:hypothetical protein
MLVIKLGQKARPGRIGAAMFANNTLHFLAGYTKCEHCTSDVKVLFTPDEVRSLEKAFGFGKRSWKARIAIMLQKWASDV